MSSRATRRRRGARNRYLQRLANEDPVGFRREWRKRLDSWAEWIKKESENWVKGSNPSAYGMFELMEQALHNLKMIGPEAWGLESEHTREFLTHRCCIEVSKRICPGMYRISTRFPNS